MDYLLGIDVGSTSMKALIFDLDGNNVFNGSHPTISIAQNPEQPNWQVFDPEHIWDGISSAIKQAVDQLDQNDRIIAAAVTGLGVDAVPLDAEGEPVYPFINWLCNRTTPQYERWLEEVGLEKTMRITGWQPFVWNTVFRIQWLRENEPEIFRTVKKWLVIEDYVNYKLTGKMNTDYTNASPTLLFDQNSLDWSDELLAIAGIDRDLLPKPQPSGSFVGEVIASAAEKTGLKPGTPIFLGGHDYLVGTLAAGVIKPGMLLDVTGTWELVITPTDSLKYSDKVREFGLTVESHSAPGMYSMWAGGTSASMLEWYKEQIGSAAQHEDKDNNVWIRLMNEAAESPVGANGVMFLPHFNGSSSPTLDPRSLGAFVGLSDFTKRTDLIRAIIEGLDYAFLDMLKALEFGSGLNFEGITAVGGGTRNEFWMQNKADVAGIPVATMMIEEATALGAAMLAGVGVGVYDNLEEAVKRVIKPGKTYEPNLNLTKVYTENFEIYKELYPALRKVNQSLYSRYRL